MIETLKTNLLKYLCEMHLSKLYHKTGKLCFLWILSEIMKIVNCPCNAFKQAERSVRNVLILSDQLSEPLSKHCCSVQPDILSCHLKNRVMIMTESSVVMSTW